MSGAAKRQIFLQFSITVKQYKIIGIQLSILGFLSCIPLFV